MCVGGPMLGEDYVNGNCQGHCRLAGSVFRTFSTAWSNSLSTSTAMLFPFSFFTTQGMRLRRASMATCISYRGGRSEERRVGSDWSSDVCSSDLVELLVDIDGDALSVQLLHHPGDEIAPGEHGHLHFIPRRGDGRSGHSPHKLNSRRVRRPEQLYIGKRRHRTRQFRGQPDCRTDCLAKTHSEEEDGVGPLRFASFALHQGIEQLRGSQDRVRLQFRDIHGPVSGGCDYRCLHLSQRSRLEIVLTPDLMALSETEYYQPNGLRGHARQERLERVEHSELRPWIGRDVHQNRDALRGRPGRRLSGLVLAGWHSHHSVRCARTKFRTR